MVTDNEGCPTGVCQRTNCEDLRGSDHGIFVGPVNNSHVIFFRIPGSRFNTKIW